MNAVLRWAKSYGIVDHGLLHGRYLHRMSPAAMSLYLFLCVVANKEGRSFYAPTTIMDILRFNSDTFDKALGELTGLALVDYRRPHFCLINIIEDKSHDQRPAQSNPVPQRPPEPVVQANCQATWHLAKHSLPSILGAIKKQGGQNGHS
jgi:hypothetical protein